MFLINNRPGGSISQYTCAWNHLVRVYHLLSLLKNENTLNYVVDEYRRKRLSELYKNVLLDYNSLLTSYISLPELILKIPVANWLTVFNIVIFCLLLYFSLCKFHC